MDGESALSRTLSRPVVAAGDGLLIARIWVWAAVVRLLKHALPLPRLVCLLRAGVRVRPRPELAKRLRLLARARSSTRLRLPGNCLDRSLALYRLLVSAGASPRLVIGVRAHAGAGFGGHVWLELNEEALGETDDDQRVFEQVIAFDAQARAIGYGADRGVRER